MKKLIFSFCFCIAAVLIIFIAVYADQIGTIIAEIVDYKIVVNDNEKQFDNPIVTINDRTYLPLREVAETLGIGIEWDGNSNKVNITTDNKQDNWDKDNDIDSLITVTYPESKLLEFRRMFITFSDMTKQIPVECIRYSNDYFYTVHKSDEGGLFFQLFDNEKKLSCSTWYTKKPLRLIDFEKIIVGTTTVGDVRKFDPCAVIVSEVSSRPVFSIHNTNDGKRIEIEYDLPAGIKHVSNVEYLVVSKIIVMDESYMSVYYNLIPIDKKKVLTMYQ